MAVQVIGAEVQHNSYVEAQSCDSLQHVRRHFEGIDPLRPQYIEIERRRAQIPPHLTGHAGALQNVVDQRRRGGFAIGAGDAHEACLGMTCQHRAIQKLHITQDGRASCRCGLRRWMGGRQMVRNARRKQQRIGAEGAGGGVLQREARRFGCRAGFGPVIPDRDLSTPGSEAPRRRQACTAKPNHGDARAGKGGEGGAWRCHLIFSVESPTSARIMAMIQKRITMVGSAQPFFSKW